MKRRAFVRALGLGAAGGLLGPAIGGLVAQARGDARERVRLFVFTDGNGWTHQAGGSRNSPTLDTTVRSPDDWDLPANLAAFAPFADRVSIARPLSNPVNGGLHGNGWATLSATRGDGANPGGRSIDRMVALALGQDDPFPSIALGVPQRRDRPPPCTSCDGPRQPFPAIGSPIDAYASIFGSRAGGDDPRAVLARDRSLLDGMVADVERARRDLVGPERAKLDQLLESYRVLERQLAARVAIFEGGNAPAAPSASGIGLRPDVIEAHMASPCKRSRSG